jgi:glycolate oxidase FAD binding subunit
MARISVSSDADVIEAVRAARDSRRTLEIVGAGTKRGFGRPVHCDDTLDLSGLSGIVKYEPDELVITARAATPVPEIEAALAEKNQRLGFEPADWGPLFGAPAGVATIGGVLSADANGSAAIRYGRCRDHLLGFHAVNGFGEAYKGGGKVVKNVTGFDLPKLFCGAMGTLGPMTEVTLRAFPKPAMSMIFAVPSLTPEDALALLRRVSASPLNSTGLVFFDGTAFVRLEGSRAGLDEKIAMLSDLLRSQPQQIADGGKMFSAIIARDIFASAEGSLWRIHVPPADAAKLFAELKPQTWYADWAGALLWAVCEPGRDIRSVVDRFDARAFRMRGGDLPPFTPEPPARAALTRRIKASFDPLRLFNPGRMWEGV